ncbi:methyltransferase domain-containing protein [Idiomarina sp. M1R2S28]|uniref:Methyltransferase domain-containing protein n=1 Tax=Idiomarina rhizosphaerae TaxID=2961572 RepID=A0A9X2G486_9GAMM|nr:methyltransferase domain-containing protein [Idiomarina rhizosphaerae]MCP1340073.1 methyltransferase domain-containing protein [Idiomarina rhizosphaerae]
MNFQQAVARQFNKAAKDYHQHASIQRLTANRLLSLGPREASQVLDVGCGPASTTAELLRRASHYLGVDIAPAMLLKAAADYPELSWLNGEWEALPVADNSVDWLFANLSLQWVDKLQQAMREAHRVLKPGGIVTINTVVEGTFNSFIKSWNAVDDLQHTHRFKSAERVQRAIGSVNWHRSEFVLEEHTQYFANVRELIGSIKGVGANYVRRTDNAGLMTRNRLQQLENAFENHRTLQGLPLEWSVLNIKLVK